jgi:BirA family transcriptional regulator, biotin operon repressor / biotin---[acetyl-CoA-carboxylase] ligase
MSTLVDPPATRVLKLLAAADGPLSGEAAAQRLKLSRTAVWKQIEALRSAGYTIEAHGRNGYRLTAVPNAAVPSELLPRLRTQTFGHGYHYLATTPSTNAVLAKLAVQGAPEGTVVVAEQQGAGRGRMTRGWFSPPGVGLYLSILLRPIVEVARVTSLPLAIGLAVADALAPHLPAGEPRVKWPNDIWIDGRKVCGILCELQAEMDGVHHVIAGIGINVNLEARALPAELQSIATSLKMATGKTVSRADLLAALLEQVERDYTAWLRHGLKPFLERLRARDALLGRTITVERTGGTLTGVADGVNPDGSLRLRLAEGRIESICSGDAHIRRR